MESTLLFDRRYSAVKTIALAAVFFASSVALAQEGDVRRGEDIAVNGLAPSVPACATCHGAKGEGGPGFPPLAGQGVAYAVEQLEAFADGSRDNAIMAPTAKGLDEQARLDVAAYFASLPSGIKPVDGPLDPNDKGAWLAQRGRLADGIPACVQCHGPGGVGVGEHFPAIAHLSADYMLEQFNAWKSDKRQPGPLNLMHDVATRLTDDDISAVIAYYTGLVEQPAAAPTTD